MVSPGAAVYLMSSRTMLTTTVPVYFRSRLTTAPFAPYLVTLRVKVSGMDLALVLA